MALGYQFDSKNITLDDIDSIDTMIQNTKNEKTKTFLKNENILMYQVASHVINTGVANGIGEVDVNWYVYTDSEANLAKLVLGALSISLVLVRLFDKKKKNKK